MIENKTQDIIFFLEIIKNIENKGWKYLKFSNMLLFYKT